MSFTPKFTLPAKLWGTDGSLCLLLAATAVIVLVMLQSNELWTMESRWAAVTLQMILKNDYLHPFLYTGPYYDKPLLSYWLILGCAKIIGNLNEWALRLPSALAAIITVYCTYKIGYLLVSRNAGLIAGWLLITLFSFDFWGRTASADMLNAAGIMLATLWYVQCRPNPSFGKYLLFFAIIALTCLCKGLIGALPLLIIFPDLVINQEWKKHINLSLLIALLIGAGIYLLPFFLSAYFGNQQVQTNGLVEVFRENIQRFFAPFDHHAPFYIYLIYLPLYLLPWTILLLPALGYDLWHWRSLKPNQRWLIKIIIILLLVLSLSGGKRSYYILPSLPFAILILADWLDNFLFFRANWSRQLQKIVGVIYLLLLCWFGIIQLLNNLHTSGIWQFAAQVHKIAEVKKPWNQWQITALKTTHDSSAIFYLQPQHEILAADLSKIDKTKIIIATKEDLAKLQLILSSYQLVAEDKKSAQATIALIPH